MVVVSRRKAGSLLVVLSAASAFVSVPAAPRRLTTALPASSKPWLKEAQSVALIAGSTVGGGVLALPTVCLGLHDAAYGEIGLMWLLNAATGLVIAEAACREAGSTTLRGLFEKKLGPAAGAATGFLLIVSNALLLAAYATEGGCAMGDLLAGGDSTIMLAPYVVGASLSVAALSEKTLDAVNSLAVLLMAATFAFVVSEWVPFCHGGSLGLPPGADVVPWLGLWRAAPVVSSALVFQSIVPVVADRLDQDDTRTKRAVLVGSFLPALAYAAFTYAVLGRLVDDGNAAASLLFRSDGLLDPLQNLPPSIAEASVLPLALFSLCAVTTSFVGTALSQRHEINGIVAGLKEDIPQVARDALALVPPALAALFFAGDDSFFVFAIALTGAVANPLLFAAFPAAMKLDDLLLPEQRTQVKKKTRQIQPKPVVAQLTPLVVKNALLATLQKKNAILQNPFFAVGSEDLGDKKVLKFARDRLPVRVLAQEGAKSTMPLPVPVGAETKSRQRERRSV